MINFKKRAWIYSRMTAMPLTVAVIIWSILLVSFAAGPLEVTVNGTSSGTLFTAENGTAILTYSSTAQVGTGAGADTEISSENASASITQQGNGSLSISASPSSYQEAKEETCGGTPEKFSGTTTVTVTVTNPANSGASVRVEEISGQNISTSKSAPFLLAPGGSFTITVEAKPDNDKDSNVSGNQVSGSVTVKAQALENNELTLSAPHGGYTITTDAGNQYSVNAESCTDPITLPFGTSITLPNAPEAENYIFYGWRLSDGRLLENGASFTLNDNLTASPIYLSSSKYSKNSDGIYLYKNNAGNFVSGPFSVNGVPYLFWCDAVLAAKGGTKPIVLIEDFTMPSTLEDNGVYTVDGTQIDGQDGNITYIIPKGVTFLIPYNDAHTLCTTKPTVDNSIQKDADYSNPTAYCTLTMGSGTNILVNGDMSLSGTQSASMCNGTFNGAPIGKLGFVNMEENSNITVSGGASLYVWGYITGNGTVTIKSNGTVYEDFQVTDYRGGNATTTMNGNDYRVFPMSQYYIQNVQVPMILEAGATEVGYMSVDSKIGPQSAPVPFIGSGAMFKIESGSITKDYLESEDRLQIDVNGTLSVSNYTINIVVTLLSIEIQSASYVVPVNGNMTINIANGSTIKIAQDVSLYPGAIIDIAPTARCELINGASMYVYDVDQWGGYCGAANRKIRPVVYAPGKQKTRGESDLVDAQIIVNGTLDATYGYIYTTTSGGNICSTGTGTAIIAAKSDATLYQAVQTDNYIAENGWIPIGISSAKLKNEDGSYVDTSSATYRYAHHGDGRGKWYAGEHVITPTVTEATCTNGGSTKNVCTCGDTQTTTTEALGHDWQKGSVTAPDCTNDGFTTYACSRCGATENREQTSSLGHDYSSSVTTQPNCGVEGVKTYTCQRCGHSYTETIPALTHNYEGVTTEPTCSSEGFTTYTCSNCGHSYVGDVIKANGHTWDKGTEITAATCTTPGSTRFTCDTCGEERIESIEANGHSYTVTTTPATCEQDGSKVSVCSACGDKQVETLPSIGHDWGDDGICKNDASHVCSHSFDAESKCTICGYGCTHDYVAGDPVPATCLEKGYTPYTCSVCQKVEYRDVTENVGDHAWEDASCTAPKTCSVCKTVEGEALGHVPGDPTQENIVNATCNTGGSYDSVVYCSRCNDELSRDTITTSATGIHSYGSWSTSAEATYSSFATQTRTCTICNTATETQHPDSAKIGETSYSTLSLAVDAAAEGDTVTLLADISGDCVISKTLTIEKNGHTANITAGDGYMADGDSAVTIWKLFKLAGTSVKVEDGLHIFFYVNNADKKDGYVAHITRTKLVKDSTNNYTVETTETAEPIPSSAWSSYSGGQLWRFSYDGIAAKEMTDIVTVIIRDSNGKQVSAVATESIEGYALRTLEKIKDQQNLRNAVLSMVNYGADAQIHFGYRTLETDHLANANLTDLSEAEKALYGKPVSATDHTASSGSIGLGGTTVTAEANLYLTFYFKDIAETKDNLTACISYTDHYNRTETITIPGSSFVSVKNSDGETLYGPRVTGIAMADGRALITCELKNGDTTLATAVSSVESYAAYNLVHSTNEALKAVCNNMINFVDYVKAYFDNPKA